MNNYIYAFILYFLLINIVSIILTVGDKLKAKRGSFRIPEKVLFMFSFLGGSVGMYITMRAIRHKTKHKKFMIGLPIIILVQIVFIFFIYRYAFL